MVDSGWKWLEDNNLGNFSIMEKLSKFNLGLILYWCTRISVVIILRLTPQFWQFLGSLPIVPYLVHSMLSWLVRRRWRREWRGWMTCGDVKRCQEMWVCVSLRQEISAYISKSQEVSCIIVIFIISGNLTIVFLMQPAPLLADPQPLPHAQAGTQVERNIHGSQDFWADWEIKSKMKKEMEQTDQQ